METVAEVRTAMIFSAELMADEVHVATVVRHHDKAITISVSSTSPESHIISEVLLTISSKAARDLAKKLIKRLSELQEW